MDDHSLIPTTPRQNQPHVHTRKYRTVAPLATNRKIPRDKDHLWPIRPGIHHIQKNPTNIYPDKIAETTSKDKNGYLHQPPTMYKETCPHNPNQHLLSQQPLILSPLHKHCHVAFLSLNSHIIYPPTVNFSTITDTHSHSLHPNTLIPAYHPHLTQSVFISLSQASIDRIDSRVSVDREKSRLELDIVVIGITVDFKGNKLPKKTNNKPSLSKSCRGAP